MQTIQDLLTISIVILCAIITITIALDLCISLIQLWNNVANKVQEVQQVYPQFNSANQSEPRLTPTSMKTISATTNSAPAIANSTNIETLQRLIQKLPQSRLRTAARRLGIKDKVDGSYQKVEVLRAQLQEKLKSQQSEVEQVLSHLY